VHTIQYTYMSKQSLHSMGFEMIDCLNLVTSTKRGVVISMRAVSRVGLVGRGGSCRVADRMEDKKSVDKVRSVLLS
jgi:hypothetical protein